MLCGISLVAGIILKAESGKVLFLPVALSAAALGLIAFLAIKRARSQRLRSRRLFILGLIIISFLTGIIRISDDTLNTDRGYMPDGSKKETIVRGTVSDIQLSDERYLISIKNPTVKLKNEEDNIDIHGWKILVYSDAMPVFNVGDDVSVKGTLYPFSEATNYGQFDQKKYYNAKGYGMKLYADEVIILKSNGTVTGRFKRTLFDTGVYFEKALDTVFNEKESGILKAMLTGDRSGLDEETKEVYKRVGIAHILSISGLHVTLLGMGLFNILMKLLKRLRFCSVITILFLFAYGVFTGFSVSTVRAVIMIVCMLCGRMLLRAYDGQSAAALAAIIILVSNPTELFETGFQLSFIAVYGIFAGNIIRKNFNIKNPVLVYFIPGFFAQLATFPIILRTYYSFSPYSFAANIILLPFMSVIVISGLVSGVFGCIFIGAGTVFFYKTAMIAGGPAHFLLNIYNEVSNRLLELPGADMITGCPMVLTCFIYYLIFFILIYLSNRYREKEVPSKERKSGLKPILVSIMAVIFMYMILMYRGKNTKLYAGFLDVGQGMCVYVEAGDISILTDGGSSNVQNVGKYRIEPFLMYRGISDIDCCFITHTDTDHISGIKEILEEGRIKIKKLVLGENYTEKEPIAELALKKGVEVVFVKTGDEMCLNETGDVKDGININIYSPDPDFLYDDKNQASQVFKLSFGDFSMLITGDSDEMAESEYVRYLRGDGGIDVLQCPHHGSKYSSSYEMLRTVQPKVTVISCSKTNVYGHPAPETLERLEKVGSKYYVTAKAGMVSVYSDGGEEFRVTGYYSRPD